MAAAGQRPTRTSLPGIPAPLILRPGGSAYPVTTPARNISTVYP